MVDTGAIAGTVAATARGWVPQLLFWLKWLLITIFIGAGLFLFYLYLQYKYAVTVFKRGGSGKEGSHTVRKISSWERARPIKDKAGMITHWKLLLANKKIPPVDLNFVYPGNKVFLYEVAIGNFIPVPLNCDESGASFNPIPQHIRQWQNLEFQQATQDYQVKNSWELYAPYMMVGATALFCCILVAVTFYFAFGEVSTMLPALKDVAIGLNNVNVIPGAPM